MNKFTKFLHELINPHCIHCREQRDIELEYARETNRCKSCESLERQNAVLIQQNNNLINKLTKNETDNPSVNRNEIEAKPLNRGRVPFSVIRQSLEMESRSQAEALRNAAKSNNESNNEIKDKSVEELEQLVQNATVSRTAETGTKQ